MIHSSKVTLFFVFQVLGDCKGESLEMEEKMKFMSLCIVNIVINAN